MICAKDGSPMWVCATAPDFKVWECYAAAHHVRDGADPPEPRGDLIVANEFGQSFSRYGPETRRVRKPKPPKPDGICCNLRCRRPAAPPHRQCFECLEIRRAAVRRFRERMAQEDLAHA